MHAASRMERNNSQRGDDGAAATPSEWIYHDVFFSHLWPHTFADDTDISPTEKELKQELYLYLCWNPQPEW